MLTIPPYPYVVTKSSSDVPLDQGWVVRPHLFFSCHLRPWGARLQRRANYTYCPDDIQVQLVFYSTFEPMVLPMGGPMDAIGVQKLCSPSPTPILYVGLAANVLGRVPLMPLFLLSNYTPTIPHQLRQQRSARFPHGLADAADELGRKGRNVTCQRVRDQPMAVAVWAGQTASGGLSVAETEERRIAVAKDGAKRAVATRA